MSSVSVSEMVKELLSRYDPDSYPLRLFVTASSNEERLYQHFKKICRSNGSTKGEEVDYDGIMISLDAEDDNKVVLRQESSDGVNILVLRTVLSEFVFFASTDVNWATFIMMVHVPA